ncbi:hypothetical protein IE53DRAFT_378985 [Violaceomyces palustris]|uniref:Uncharacterized protein n=1 Tax=Violaceomyces palustris TaxID=1673888 RepID=A0ACD0P004_9BASI|nr:hypothetical protein IE53DRAFT_378985 [Violaceomyces palustris]
MIQSRSPSSIPKRQLELGQPDLELNGIPIGFIPDVGYDGGSPQSMTSINAWLSGRGKSATYGFYDQAAFGKIYKGEKILSIIDDLYNSGAILEAAIMPTGGWGGFTLQDDSQARAVCQVMKKFTDQGIQVRLRFAHEVNWYVTTGEYASGQDQGVSEFIVAFEQVAKACKDIAPSVKMWYSPNAADLTVYEKYLPNMSMVSIIGVDFYPEEPYSATAQYFIDTLKPFHDKYTSDAKGGIKLAVAEAGTHVANATLEDRIAWLKSITSDQVKQQLPNLVSITWYNALRQSDVLQNAIGSDFRILDPSPQSDRALNNTAFLSLFPSISPPVPASPPAPLPSPLSSSANSFGEAKPSVEKLGLLAALTLCFLGVTRFLHA